jgi:alcohol dehydrogenase class IV
MDKPFVFTGMPRLDFGPGKLNTLSESVKQFGNGALLITGKSSFNDAGRLEQLLGDFKSAGISICHFTVAREPSPGMVDQAVSEFSSRDIHSVIAIGGGSAIDAGKTVAAMMGEGGSVKDYLDGVGDKSHSGITLPLIAVPTTAGTGSEATKNAVLSEVGPQGYKKSLRHDNFIPYTALLDPELAITCPAEVTAACGMDAFTQLLEAYVSVKSSPLTDVLALEGISRVFRSLVPACTTESKNVSVRGDMAYAAFLSGVTLAQAGLGVVHGLASPLGGLASIPHGVVCGTMLAPAVRITIASLSRGSATDSESFLAKYAAVGQLMISGRQVDTEEGCRRLVEQLYEWSQILALPRLSKYGITEEQIEAVVEGASNKNNPVALTKDEIREIVVERL